MLFVYFIKRNEEWQKKRSQTSCVNEKNSRSPCVFIPKKIQENPAF